MAPAIWIITPEAKPRYPYGNCLYIEDDSAAVIDLGAGGRAFADIPAKKVELAFISHFHFDHVHGDSFFPEAELYAAREESQTYSNEKEYLKYHGYDMWDKVMPGIKREAYGKVIPLPDDIPVQPGFRNIPLSGTFTNLDRFDLGKRSITSIHLPGHTAGHYGFYLEKDGILFSGDIDLVAGGPWYSSNSASVGDFMYSVQRIKEINPRIVVPSHRRAQFQNIPQQLDRYLQVVLDRENKIFDLLQEPQTLADLAEHGLVFPERNNNYELFWERMTIRNHLQHLIENNLVTEIAPGLYEQL